MFNLHFGSTIWDVPAEYSRGQMPAFCDAVLEIALNNCANSGIRPHSIQFGLPDVESCPWFHVPAWEHVDLSCLTDLKADGPHGIDDVVLEPLLAQACGTIKTLECSTSWPMLHHKPSPTLELTGLRTFQHADGQLHPDMLFVRLDKMPALHTIKLCGTRLHGSYDDWRKGFTALRDTPYDLRICFDQIIICDWTEYFASCISNKTKQDESKEPSFPVGGYTDIMDGWVEVDRQLPLYLSREIEWTRTVRKWLEDSLDYDSGSESDSENNSGLGEDYDGRENSRSSHDEQEADLLKTANNESNYQV